MTAPEFISTKEAAERLDVSARRVRQLIASGQLAATKVGRDYIISAAAVEAYEPQPVGYPKGRRRKRDGD